MLFGRIMLFAELRIEILPAIIANLDGVSGMYGCFFHHRHARRYKRCPLLVRLVAHMGSKDVIDL